MADLRGEREAFGGVESGSGEVEVVLEASTVKVNVVAGGEEGSSVFGFQGVKGREAGEREKADSFGVAT